MDKRMPLTEPDMRIIPWYLQTAKAALSFMGFEAERQYMPIIRVLELIYTFKYYNTDSFHNMYGHDKYELNIITPEFGSYHALKSGNHCSHSNNYTSHSDNCCTNNSGFSSSAFNISSISDLLANEAFISHMQPYIPAYIFELIRNYKTFSAMAQMSDLFNSFNSSEVSSGMFNSCNAFSSADTSPGMCDSCNAFSSADTSPGMCDSCGASSSSDVSPGSFDFANLIGSYNMSDLFKSSNIQSQYDEYMKHLNNIL